MRTQVIVIFKDCTVRQIFKLLNSQGKATLPQPLQKIHFLSCSWLLKGIPKQLVHEAKINASLQHILQQQCSAARLLDCTKSLSCIGHLRIYNILQISHLISTHWRNKLNSNKGYEDLKTTSKTGSY